MNDGERPPLDIDREISSLEFEYEDLMRDMKWNAWLTLPAAAAIFSASPRWFDVLDWTQTMVALGFFILVVGFTEKLNKHRLANIHGQITMLRIASQADTAAQWRAKLILEHIRDLPPASR